MEVFKHCKCVIMRNRMQARNEYSLRLMDTRVRALQERDYDTANNAANFDVAKDATPSRSAIIRRFRYSTPTVTHNLATAWLFHLQPLFALVINN